MTLLTTDAVAPGGIDGSGTRRHRRRAHDRQQPDEVPLRARRREDAGGRGGLRGGGAEVPRRRLHRRRGRSQGDRADARVAGPVGMGRRQRANGEGARPRRAAHRLRARLAADAGRGLGARRARHVRRALHVLQRHRAARRQPAREVRRDHLPTRRRHGAGTDQRHPEGRHHAAALPQDRRHAAPRRARPGRRHPRRHGHGRADGTGEVRARGRHADHRGLDGVDPAGVRDDQRTRRSSGRPACSRAGRS